MAKKHCPHCDAPMVEYKHKLSRPLARGLYAVARAGGKDVKLSDLKLDISTHTNFYKLRYWGLVVKSDKDSERGGRWTVTDLGYDFLRGDTLVSERVISYRGQAVGAEGDMVSIQVVTGGWWLRPDYVEHSEPRED